MAKKRTKDTYAVRAQLARMASQVYGDKYNDWSEGFIPSYGFDKNAAKRVEQAKNIAERYIVNMRDKEWGDNPWKYDLNTSPKLESGKYIGNKPWNSRRSGGYTRYQYTGKSDAQYKSESDARHAMPADWKTPPRSKFAKKATMVSASANAVG